MSYEERSFGVLKVPGPKASVALWCCGLMVLRLQSTMFDYGYHHEVYQHSYCEGCQKTL